MSRIEVMALARPDLLELTAYVCARMSQSDGLILLNANENPEPPIGVDQGESLNRYPQPQPDSLAVAMANFYQVRVEQILMTRGSDEAIDLLMRAFCRAGKDAIVQCPPCFGLYANSARIQGASVIDVPLFPDHRSEFDELDIDGIVTAVCEHSVKLVFVTHPNNPTGRLIRDEQLRRLLEVLDGKTLVIVDEAYLEYTNEPSASRWLPDQQHLVVLRTLSKAFALAGVRVGCALAHPQIIGLLRQIMPPYPLPVPSIEAAQMALSDSAVSEMRSRLMMLGLQRDRVQAALGQCDFIQEHYPTHANFILIRSDHSASLYQWLLTGGVIIRDFSSKPGLQGALRITMGSPVENDRLIELLETYTP